MTRQRDRHRTIAIKLGRKGDWTKYKKCRNKVNNLKKFAKQKYLNNLEDDLTNSRFENPKKYWKYIRSLTKSKSSHTIPILKTVQNNNEIFHYSDIEKANCLNEYFASISTINDSSISLPVFNKYTNSSISSVEISYTDIENLIDSLSVNKAVGFDQISHRLLKAVKHTISKPLEALFNRSLELQIFPNKWKYAMVMPLFKKGDTSDVGNYRPISLLSCIGKLMERCVHKHLYNYLQSNNLIHSKQSGFLKGHSTVHQLLDIYHHVVQAIDYRQNLCMVFCDISKAFDRVWHPGLVFKLRQLGINGPFLNWLHNYISLREQSVMVGTAISSKALTNAGVPQGSVLGPLLFLVYVNDISENLVSISRLFADDTSLACSATSINDIEGILNHDLLIISQWAKQWMVSFNPLKSEAILFSNQSLNPPSLTFNDTPITFVNNHKHLGISLSNDGKWHEYISNTLTSASKILGIMRSLKFKIRRESLNQIYVSFLRPILEYASVVWDNCTAREQESLEKVQNEAARIVTGVTRSVSLNNLYREIGWLSLSDRRAYQKLILTFKIVNGLCPTYLSDIFPSTVGARTDYPLRNASDIDIIRRRTEIFANSFIPSAVSRWNELPLGIRSINSLSLFKSKIRNMFSSAVVPKHFFIGARKLAVLQTRIRNKCSDLRSDLFTNHLAQDTLCLCGHLLEDAEHYFFQCEQFSAQRLKLFSELRMYHPLNTSKLLFGSVDFNYEDNCKIFLTVHTFIKESKRFL